MKLPKRGLRNGRNKFAIIQLTLRKQDATLSGRDICEGSIKSGPYMVLGRP